jgi:hypothetical protein
LRLHITGSEQNIMEESKISPKKKIILDKSFYSTK